VTHADAGRCDPAIACIGIPIGSNHRAGLPDSRSRTVQLRGQPAS
jgi:hypothetical protein